jgi:uncharacterized protein YbjT (DUF2867 family)
MSPVFVTGGTGYLGRPLIECLVARGSEVHALVRPGSEAKLPRGARAVRGNALDAASFVDAIPPRATVVHLVGTPHPNPAKAAEFRSVDLASIRAVTIAARKAGALHLVYVSAAHPAPVMKAYIAVRVEGEALVRETGIPATILRPWYVLGPGHRWPYALLPVYAVLRAIPATRESARRLGLVTRHAMVETLARAVADAPPSGVRTIEVEEIRQPRQSTKTPR